MLARSLTICFCVVAGSDSNSSFDIARYDCRRACGLPLPIVCAVLYPASAAGETNFFAFAGGAVGVFGWKSVSGSAPVGWVRSASARVACVGVKKLFLL